MLARKTSESKLEVYGYQVSVEIERGGETTPAQVADKLADGPRWLLGVGAVDVECVGIMESYPDSDKEPE